MMDNNEVNWGEVIDFFSKKYISLRAMLMGSEISVENDNINVMLKSKGKFMLEQKMLTKLLVNFCIIQQVKHIALLFLNLIKLSNVKTKKKLL